MSCVECRVWSVKCKVWSVKCKMWSVKCKVWSGTSEVLRLPRKMTMEVSKVLRLPRKMHLVFWKRCESIAPITQNDFRHIVKHVGMSRSATPATRNDATRRTLRMCIPLCMAMPPWIFRGSSSEYLGAQESSRVRTLNTGGITIVHVAYFHYSTTALLWVIWHKLCDDVRCNMWDNWEDVWGWDLSMRGPPLCFRIGQRKKPRWIVPGPQGLHAQRVWSNRYACFSFHSLHSRHDMSWQCSIWTTITTTREIHRRQPRLSDLSGIGAWLLNTGSFGHRKRSWPSKGPRMAQSFGGFSLAKLTHVCVCKQQTSADCKHAKLI